MTLDDIRKELERDTRIDDAALDAESLRIPQLHGKYLNFLMEERLSLARYENDVATITRDKWEYYTGKLDDDELAKYGWSPYPFVLKSDITTYLESDEDLNKYQAQKVMHDEVVDICQSILKELNSRTFQLRDFIAWERFIQGVRFNIT